MRIVTWNVNSLKMRLPRVLEFLADHRPDVLLVQETKSAPAAFPTLELATAGYQSHHLSAGRWAGVAILARDELELSAAARGLPGEPAAQEARWCEATVNGIRFASVYVPNGRALDSPEFPRKLGFLDAIAARVMELHGAPAVIAGDFNVTRADIDVYDPAVFEGSTHVTEAERGRFEHILAAGALVDAYRQLHADEVQYTWWDYRAGHFHKGLGLRLDYALVSEELAPRLRTCGIVRDYRKGQKPSDHAPLLLDVD